MFVARIVLCLDWHVGAHGHSGENVSRCCCCCCSPIPSIPRAILGSRWEVDGRGGCWRGLEGMRPNISKPGWKRGSFWGAAGATHSIVSSSFSIFLISRANWDGLRGAEGTPVGLVAGGEENMMLIMLPQLERQQLILPSDQQLIYLGNESALSDWLLSDDSSWWRIKFTIISRKLDSMVDSMGNSMVALVDSMVPMVDLMVGMVEIDGNIGRINGRNGRNWW